MATLYDILLFGIGRLVFFAHGREKKTNAKTR